MPASCPSCHAAIAQSPPPPRCPSCGSPLRGPVPKLVIRMPGGVASEFPVNERLSLGRNPQRNNVCISDREVSKEHAVVERRGSEVILRDLQSSNGTFVNEAKVSEVRLKDGDVIRLGTTQIVYMGAEVAAPPITIATPSPRTASGQIAAQNRANLTVVHSFNAPVLAQVKASTERNLKPVAEFKDFDALKEEYDRLRIAVEFQEKIKLNKGDKLDLDVLLEQILNFAHSTLKADNGAILKRTDAGFEASHIKQRNANAAGFNVSDTLLEQVVTTRSALLIQDVDVDPRFSAAQSIVSQGIKCAMGVPLLTYGEVRAVLYLDILQRTHTFTETHLKLLNAIAIQAAFTLENAELLDKVDREAKQRADLSRFLPPQLVEQALKGEFDLEPKKTDITVLFSDIRGFTSMSEKETPENVVSMLNDYFELMVGVVLQYGGTLDKFIGDSLMALWGTPRQHPEDAENAVMAALEMQRRMIAFNRQRDAAGKPRIFIGIGVNSGPCVVGRMGGSQRSDYTAIGDTVNLASRLCHEARANEIIISGYTQRLLPKDKFDLDTSMPAAQVKGKEKRIPIARVIDYASEATMGAR